MSEEWWTAFSTSTHSLQLKHTRSSPVCTCSARAKESPRIETLPNSVTILTPHVVFPWFIQGMRLRVGGFLDPGEAYVWCEGMDDPLAFAMPFSTHSRVEMGQQTTSAATEPSVEPQPSTQATTQSSEVDDLVAKIAQLPHDMNKRSWHVPVKRIHP